MTCITGNGKTFQVSDEDADLLDKPWTAVCYSKKYWYVWRRKRSGRNAPKMYLHRVILARMFPNLGKVIDTFVVDHANGDGLDNRRENLRYSTRTLNRANSGAQSTTSSGYRGVHWNSNRKQWVARVRSNRKHYFLGYFDNKHDAAKRWNEKATELYGEFARLNEICQT